MTRDPDTLLTLVLLGLVVVNTVALGVCRWPRRRLRERLTDAEVAVRFPWVTERTGRGRWTSPRA